MAEKQKVTVTRTLIDLGTNDPEIIRKAIEMLNYAPEPMTFMATRNGKQEPVLLLSQRAFEFLQTSIIRIRREMYGPVIVPSRP